VLLPSRTDLFPATDLSPNQFSFSRSYGVNWPSSFAIVLLKPLCISHTPTCVGFQYGFFFSWDSFQDQLDSTSILFSKSSPYTSSLFSPFSFPHWASFLCDVLSTSEVNRHLHALSPSGFAFQLPIRNRLTQLEILFCGTFVRILLEPLGFRPNRFSRFFPLLMSTFSLLIAPAKSHRLPSPRYTERSTTLKSFSTSITASALY